MANVHLFTPSTEIDQAPSTAPDSGLRASRPSAGRVHLLMLLATFCWATNIIAGKEALSGLGPLALTQLRVLGATIVFGILYVGLRRPSLRLNRRQWRSLGMVALFGIALNQLCFIGGLARSTAAHTALIVALGPVMVLALSCSLRMESLTWLKSAGMLISFSGLGVLTAGKAGHEAGGTWMGDFILVAGSAVFAYFVILAKEVADRYNALTLNLIIFALGSLMLAPFTAHDLLRVRWDSVPGRAWWGLAFMIGFGSVVAYLIFAFALTALAPSRVAAFSYLQPVIAVALGVWMLGERLTVRIVVGGLTILLGVYLTERERAES